MKTESIQNYVNCLENDDYNVIEELKIDRLSIDGEILEVDLTELNYFPNLKILTLANIIISYEDLSIIQNLNLKVLRLSNCELADTFESLINVDELILDNTTIDINKLNNIKKIEVRNMDININGIRCDELNISNAILLSLNDINVNKVLLSKEQYSKYNNYFKHIKVIIKDKYDSIVGELDENN